METAQLRAEISVTQSAEARRGRRHEDRQRLLDLREREFRLPSCWPDDRVQPRAGQIGKVERHTNGRDDLDVHRVGRCGDCREDADMLETSVFEHMLDALRIRYRLRCWVLARDLPDGAAVLAEEPVLAGVAIEAAPRF